MKIFVISLPDAEARRERAARQLEELGLVSEDGREGARKVLRAAAMTYVAGVASSAGYLVYLLIIFGGSIFKVRR